MKPTDSQTETTARQPDEAPVGWIHPRQFSDMWLKAMAYRRQLIDNGIKPDLEKYSRDREEIDNAL